MKQMILSVIIVWKIILLFTSALFFVACETNEGEPAYTGHDYFGHTEGKWVIYDVDSTVYDDFLGEVFHFQYQVMERNQEFFENAQGEQAMRVERFIRQDETQEWQVKNVWTSSLNPGRALKTEENITYVKLAFPLKPNLSWNGNLFNTAQEQIYKITSLHEPLQLDNMLLDSTLTVLQKDFKTLIGEDYQLELYAPRIGLVRKKFLALEREIDGTVTRGVDYSYELVGYGYNTTE